MKQKLHYKQTISSIFYNVILVFISPRDFREFCFLIGGLKIWNIYETQEISMSLSMISKKGHIRVLPSVVYSHFDVNLFRHRHFWFIILSIIKTNFLYKMDFTYMQVVDLRRFLQERGVSCSFHWKYQ